MQHLTVIKVTLYNKNVCSCVSSPENHGDEVIVLKCRVKWPTDSEAGRAGTWYSLFSFQRG